MASSQPSSSHQSTPFSPSASAASASAVDDGIDYDIATGTNDEAYTSVTSNDEVSDEFLGNLTSFHL